jgi:hypothetical protein
MNLGCRQLGQNQDDSGISTLQSLLRSFGSARAFAGLAHAAALALGTSSPGFAAASDLPRNNRDWNRRVLLNASGSIAPEAFPRALAACATH